MAATLQKGSLLGGRYELRSALDDVSDERVTVAGWDRVLERDVAIRICGAEGEGRARFLRDAKILARVQSPHVVGVYDVGPHRDEAGPAFLVTEPVEGESLRVRIDSSGTFPVERAIAIAREIALALVAVHGAGLAHGRVTPSRVVLAKHADGSERPKLLDAVGEGDAPADVPGDLRAVGAILFEMLEGAPPPSVLVAHRSDPLASDPGALLSARIPRAVADVVRKCLSTTPGEQFDSARSVERALAAATSRQEVGSSVGAFPELVLDPPPAIEAPAERVDPVHGVPPPKIATSMYDGPPEIALAEQGPLDLSIDLDGTVREAPIGRSLTDDAGPSDLAPLSVDGLIEAAPAPPRAPASELAPAEAPFPIVPIAPPPPPIAPTESPSSSPFAVLPAHVHMRLGVGALILGAMAFAFTQSLLVFAFFLSISLFGTVGYFVRRRADGLE